MTKTNSILTDIASTLRSTDLFVQVAAGQEVHPSAVPQANVRCQGTQHYSVDHDATQRDVRLTVHIDLITRAGDRASATARLIELAELTQLALLADTSRAGACHDLPAGAATEIVSLELHHSRVGSKSAPSAPLYQASLAIRCHYRTDLPATLLDTILLDDAPLFDSGPCELTAHPWPRQFVHRPLAGRDSEVILDLGRRSRTVVQTGQLRGSTALELALQIDRLENLPGAQQYTLVDAFGQTYFPVLVETAGLTASVTRGPSFTADYEILYRQLS
jgi:hypothetical protein